MTRVSWPPVLAHAKTIVESYDTGVTLRQLFYRIVADGTLPNLQTYYRRLSSQTAEGRRAGTFPELLDRTSRIERALSFDGVTDALDQLRDWYRRDRTEGQPWSIYLGVEKAGLSEQLDAQYAKTIRARRRREKAERETALAVDDNLTELVRDGTISPSVAIQIRADRARKAKKEAEQEAERQRWLERQEEERRMSPAWAEFVLAHSPGWADSVMQGTITLREAVQTIEKDTDCQFGCQVHFPLTPAEVETLITLMGEAEDGLDREKAALVLEWAPTRVVNYEALAQIRECMLSDGGAP